MPKVSVTVHIDYKDVPPRSEIVDYVEEAVQFWGGQRRSDDWNFPDNIKKVTARDVFLRAPIK